MGKKKKSPHFPAKKWGSIFAEDRIPKEEPSYVEWKRKINEADNGVDLSLEDGIDLFLEDDENSAPSREIEDVKEFCRGECIESVKSGMGVAGEWRRAILNDRSCIGSDDGGCECNSPLTVLTATELYECLKKPWKKLVRAKPRLHVPKN
jgi:hypothetical protein